MNACAHIPYSRWRLSASITCGLVTSLTLAVLTGPVVARPLVAIANDIKSVDDTLDRIRKQDEDLDRQIDALKDPSPPTTPSVGGSELSLLTLVPDPGAPSVRLPSGPSVRITAAGPQAGGHARPKLVIPADWDRLPDYDRVMFFIAARRKEHSSQQLDSMEKSMSGWEQVLWTIYYMETWAREPKFKNRAVWEQMSRNEQLAHFRSLDKNGTELGWKGVL